MEAGRTERAHGAVRILVVDDEPEIRRVLKALLSRSPAFQAEIDDAADGETALAMITRQRYDIIISDFRMKGTTGIDVLELAADLAPASGRVLVTALADLDIAVDAVNRGRVSGFVRKPWDSRQLLALVESLAPAAPAPGVATYAPPPPARDLRKEIEDVEHQLRQLRVRFGMGGISAEGYRQFSEELRQKRARLESELFGQNRH